MGAHSSSLSWPEQYSHLCKQIFMQSKELQRKLHGRQNGTGGTGCACHCTSTEEKGEEEVVQLIDNSGNRKQKQCVTIEVSCSASFCTAGASQQKKRAFEGVIGEDFGGTIRI